MSRQPTLMHPQAALLPEVPYRPARLIPWGYVALGVASLTAAAAVAWFTVGQPLTLNVPGKGDTTEATASLDRAVATANVDLERGVTLLSPVRAGRVTAVMANEGDEVEKDAPLLQIDDSHVRDQLEEAKTALAASRIAKKKAEQGVIQHRGLIRSQEAMVVVREKEVAEASAGVQKAKAYRKDKLGAIDQDVWAAEAVVAKTRAAVSGERAKLEALRETDPSVAVELADVDIQAKTLQVAKAEAELARYTLRAPSKGKVLRSSVTAGEVWGPMTHKPAFEFWPEGAPLIIRAEVEQEYAGLVRVGMKASVIDYDSAGTSWQGTVTRTGDWISPRRSRLLEPMQFNDVRTLETIIKLDTAPSYPLKIGQRVRVVLDR